jgi:SEC-C motif domain protein
MGNCPCGSGRAYLDCCEPIISGKQPAETAEQLMRARYSAHTKVDVDFIFNSTHPNHRQGYDHKGTRRWAEGAEWLGLEIRDTALGGPDDAEGEVEFVVRFRDKDGIRTYHERGQFKRDKQRWYFTEGEMVKPAPLSVSKIGRNDPCSCGSGKKYKKCCG